MPNYLETIYFRDEFKETDYPQKLCNYIFEKYFKNNKSGNKLLDIGSGKGNHLVGFSRKGLDVFGIDKRKECLEAVDKTFEIKECDLEKDAIPYESNTFDFIFSKSVIEHVRNADNFVSESNRVLKPGGIAIHMTPDWGTQYKTFWDDYTHVQAWTRKSLQNCMKMHDFDNVNCFLFRQLPILWEYPFLSFLSDIVSILPERFKWKDKNEEVFNTFIRFSKEKMLIGYGKKKEPSN